MWLIDRYHIGSLSGVRYFDVNDRVVGNVREFVFRMGRGV